MIGTWHCRSRFDLPFRFPLCGLASPELVCGGVCGARIRNLSLIRKARKQACLVHLPGKSLF